MRLSESQALRYSRNIVLDAIGESGQQRLLSSRVLIVGAGGLGSPAGLYLAAAGVGAIGIVDSDCVDLTNLQRQILHNTSDIGRPKPLSAAEAITALNPDVQVIPYQERFDVDGALRIIKDYDFVIDATDNFVSKFLVADACHFARKPYSHAGVLGFEGQTMTVRPGQTACYRCVFHAPPAPDTVPSGARVGVLGTVPGVLGTIQATEAIKCILGIGNLLTDRILTYSALAMRFRSVDVKRNPECPLCGQKAIIAEPLRRQ